MTRNEAGGVLLALLRLAIDEGLTTRMQELHDALLRYEMRQREEEDSGD